MHMFVFETNHVRFQYRKNKNPKVTSAMSPSDFIFSSSLPCGQGRQVGAFLPPFSLGRDDRQKYLPGSLLAKAGAYTQQQFFCFANTLFFRQTVAFIFNTNMSGIACLFHNLHNTGEVHRGFITVIIEVV